jgi:hypothetical protein
MDRAGTALTLVATLLGTEKTESLAQNVEESGSGVEVSEMVDFIINSEANLITTRAGLRRGGSNQTYGAYGSDGNGELAPSQLKLAV